jgi:hypothetical protein
MMKTRNVILLVGLLFCGNAFSQDVISRLKTFYNEADMDYYTGIIEKNVWDCYKAQCVKWNVAESVNPPRTDLLKGNTVPMLAVQFVDMEDFDLGENIYDHITIDSTRVFTLACVDDQMKVLAFANYYDGTYAWTDLNSVRPSEIEILGQVIKNINERQPELILFCHSLKRPRDLNSFMYIKDGLIYVYRAKEDDVIELNNYVGLFFTNEDARNLGYTAVPFVQQFYEKEAPRRRTGTAPGSRKMISPSSK